MNRKRTTHSTLGLIFAFIGMAFLIIASFSTLIGLGVGLYDWAHGVEFAVAAWSGFKTFLISLLCVIPGGLFILIGKSL